jgi:hypothetical protein
MSFLLHIGLLLLDAKDLGVKAGAPWVLLTGLGGPKYHFQKILAISLIFSCNIFSFMVMLYLGVKKVRTT